MSYKLALHVLATFTEQVVPIHKHVTFFWTISISGKTNSHNGTNGKGSGEQRSLSGAQLCSTTWPFGQRNLIFANSL